MPKKANYNESTKYYWYECHIKLKQDKSNQKHLLIFFIVYIFSSENILFFVCVGFPMSMDILFHIDICVISWNYSTKNNNFYAKMYLSAHAIHTERECCHLENGYM